MSLLGVLIILGIFGSLSPALAGTHLRILEGRNGLQRGLFFMVAYIAVLLVLGLVLMASFSGNAGTPAATVTGTAVGLVGVLLLVLAFRRLVGAPDEDAPPEEWIGTTVTSGGALRSLGLGLAMPLLGVKNLAVFLVGLGLILGAGRAGFVEYPLLILFVALFSLQLIIPFVLALVFPMTGGVMKMAGGVLNQRRLVGGILQVVVGLFLIWIALGGSPPPA